MNDLPLIFLLGPDYGGGGWQDVMYGHIQRHAKERGLGDYVVAIPRRYAAQHPMYSHQAPSTVEGFKYQLDWETDYIERAALGPSRGCVAIWLPEESAEEPRTDGEPYARDTRGEIGTIIGWLKYEKGVRFVAGAHSGFKGLDVIRRRFARVLGAPLTLYDSIDDLARGAVRVAKRPRW